VTDVLIRTADEASAVEQVDAGAEPPKPRGAAQRAWRGRVDDPAWARPALLGLLGATALLYLWGLGASGWANTYYAAAVQAGSKSWKAFFFGSLDSGNSITVDKSPGFLWVMDISARLFGVNSWSILVPQALEGVAAVGVLYATVRRWFTPLAALLAGAVLALTPVAALMFRFNNPDALLVLLLTAGAYALTRALEHGSTRWLVFAFSLVGFGFLAKMLQALIVLPVFALVYLFAGPPRLGRRIYQLFLGGIATLVAAGWWIAIVQLTPASSRPYIGGSQNNSLWNLIFGYNGFGRLTGNENGSVGGGTQAGSRWGPTGLTRLFNSDFGGQISWLLPAALILLVAGLVLTARRVRTDRTRAALLLWGGWLVVTGAAFSLGQGIIHPYYTIALGPAIGALIGIGAVTLWSRRTIVARYTLMAAFAVTIAWSYVLLDRTPSWHPWLRTALLIAGFGVGGALLAWPLLSRSWTRVVLAAAVVTALLGPGAYTLATAATPHSGAIPSAGPAVAGGFGPGGGQARAFGGANGGPGAGRTPGGFTGLPPGGAGGAPLVGNGQRPFGVPGGGGRGGGLGGLLGGTTVSSQLKTLLADTSSRYTWVAATVSANNAASYQLASDGAVMAIGGFNGTDPSPTPAQFRHDVAAHKIHYFIGGTTGGGVGNGFGGQSGSSSATSISSWVAGHFTATTVGGVTLYDLTNPTTGSGS
jgi:4-amino-4-deoxy-L-arabinose transferase-like glycosyltransferase